MWNSIAAYHVHFDVVVSFLGRSAPTAARLMLGIDATNVSLGLHILPRYLSRLSRLRLDLLVSYTFNEWGDLVLSPDMPEKLTPDNWRSLSALLRAPASLLAELKLINTMISDWEQMYFRFTHPLDSSDPHYWEIPSDLLSGEPGALRSCYLRGIQLPRQFPRALARLTKFEYRAGIRMTPAYLDDILASLPELQRLGLSYHDFDDSDGSRCQVVHPSLRKVAVFRVVEDQSGIITYLERHALEDIYVRHSCPNTLIHHDSIAEIIIQRCCVSVRFAEPHRARVTGAFEERVPRDKAFPASFASITTLTVAEPMWMLYAPFPPAPRLQVLRIAMGGCAESAEWLATTDGDDSTLFSCGADTALECPALRLLEISSSDPGCCSKLFWPTCSCSCRFSFIDVATFIRTCLRFESLRLHTLRMHGTECIDIDPEAAWDAVSAVVDFVEILPAPASDMLVNVTMIGPLTGVFDGAYRNEYTSGEFCNM